MTKATPLWWKKNFWLFLGFILFSNWKNWAFFCETFYPSFFISIVVNGQKLNSVVNLKRLYDLNYDHRAFIRLATGHTTPNEQQPTQCQRVIINFMFFSSTVPKSSLWIQSVPWQPASVGIWSSAVIRISRIRGKRSDVSIWTATAFWIRCSSFNSSIGIWSLPAIWIEQFIVGTILESVWQLIQHWFQSSRIEVFRFWSLLDFGPRPEAGTND